MFIKDFSNKFENYSKQSVRKRLTKWQELSDFKTKNYLL